MGAFLVGALEGQGLEKSPPCTPNHRPRALAMFVGLPVPVLGAWSSQRRGWVGDQLPGPHGSRSQAGPRKRLFFIQAAFGEVPTMCQGLGWKLGAGGGKPGHSPSLKGLIGQWREACGRNKP